MKRARERMIRHNEAAELDVTPFMNLMIVLVPVLLLSMVFTHTTVIDLNFPSGENAAGGFDPPPPGRPPAGRRAPGPRAG